MAYNPNELYSDADVSPSPRIAAKRIGPKTFASGSGTLAKGTPVARSSATTFWVPWTNAGGNQTGTIRGFVWPDDVVLDSDEEVLGQVMLEGDLHYDDIPVPTGETAANMATALKVSPGVADGLPSCRELGLHIQGLPDTY